MVEGNHGGGGGDRDNVVLGAGGGTGGFERRGGDNDGNGEGRRRWLVFDGKHGPLLYLSLETYHKGLGKVF